MGTLNLTLEMKTAMCEMKNTLDGVDSRLEIAKEKIRKCENIAI